MTLRFPIAVLAAVALSFAAPALAQVPSAPGPQAIPDPAAGAPIANPPEIAEPAPPPAPPPLPFHPRASGSRITFGADVWPTDGNVVATIGLTAQIAASEHVVIDADVPWAFGSARGLGFGKVRGAFGNVTLGAHGVLPLAPTVALSIGGTVSIPTRYVFSGSSDQLTFVTRAAYSRGFYDAYRFGPEVVYLRVPIGFEARFGRFFYYRAELDPEVWIPAASELDNHSPQLLLEHADEIEVRAPFGFGGGVRLQFAFAVTQAIAFAGGDRAQAAMEPFVGYEPPGRGFFARGGLLLALDTPLGTGFKTGGLASLRTQLGFKF